MKSKVWMKAIILTYVGIGTVLALIVSIHGCYGFVPVSKSVQVVPGRRHDVSQQKTNLKLVETACKTSTAACRSVSKLLPTSNSHSLDGCAITSSIASSHRSLLASLRRRTVVGYPGIVLQMTSDVAAAGEFSNTIDNSDKNTRSNNIVKSTGTRKQRRRKRKIALDAVLSPIRHAVTPIVVAITIGVFSVMEIVETLPEIRWWAVHEHTKLGHGHSMVILAILRLVRSVSILYTQLDEIREETEDYEIFSRNKHSNNNNNNRLLSILSIPHRIIGRYLFNPFMAMTACLVAVGASAFEIYADLSPGGHHGACLLALSELNFQWHRLRHYKKHHLDQRLSISSSQETSQGQEPKQEQEQPPNRQRDNIFQSFVRRWRPLIQNKSCFVRMVVGLAAAGFALYEIIEDLSPGGHHGVIVLAIAECVENIHRSGILQRA